LRTDVRALKRKKKNGGGGERAGYGGLSWFRTTQQPVSASAMHRAPPAKGLA